jgi:hypothetical protein
MKSIYELKLFKIGILNLKGKSKEWFKKLTTIPIDWQTMKGAMLLKYGIMNLRNKSKLNWIQSNKNPSNGFLPIMIGWKSCLQGENWKM